MTKVAVYHESADPGLMPYRAVSGRNQAMGRTAGEALDALASQLPQEDAETLVIVRNMSRGPILQRRATPPVGRTHGLEA